MLFGKWVARIHSTLREVKPPHYIVTQGSLALRWRTLAVKSGEVVIVQYPAIYWYQALLVPKGTRPEINFFFKFACSRHPYLHYHPLDECYPKYKLQIHTDLIITKVSIHTPQITRIWG